MMSSDWTGTGLTPTAKPWQVYWAAPTGPETTRSLPCQLSNSTVMYSTAVAQQAVARLVRAMPTRTSAGQQRVDQYCRDRSQATSATTAAPRLPGRPAVRVVSPAAHPRSESGRAGPGSPRWLPTTTPTTRPTADRFAATALEVGDDAALTVQIRSLMWWSRSGAASTYRLHRRRAQPGGALTHPLRRRRPVRGHRCGQGGPVPLP